MQIFLRHVSKTRFQAGIAEDFVVYHKIVGKTVNNVADGIFEQAHH